MDLACASFSLLRWTRSNIPRGSQLDHRPQSRPANGERGPSDRHFLQPRGVGHRGGAYTLSQATPLVTAAVSHAGNVLEDWSVKKADSHSDTQICYSLDDYIFFAMIHLWCMSTHRLVNISKNTIRLSSALQAACKYPSICYHIMYTYGVLTNISLLLQPRFLFHRLHYSLFCLAYVSARLSICLGFCPSFSSTCISRSLQQGLWML